MLTIGLSANIFHADPQRPLYKNKALFYAEESMVMAFAKRGCKVQLLPPLQAHTDIFAAMIASVDGVVITGGVDVAPESYGEKPLAPEWQGDRQRDVYEIALIQACLKTGTPILGICRGIQIINVALGGTLWQDITTCIPGSLVHRNWDVYEDLHHKLKVLPQTPLSKLYSDKEVYTVNSIHHQAVKKLGKGLIAEAMSEDGLVEAVASKEPESYIRGVQWHPEFFNKPGLMPAEPLWEDFFQACRQRH